MSNNDTVDLNNTAQTLTEAGYDGQFRVHTNVHNGGMFDNISVSSGTEKVIIKNTIIDMRNVTPQSGTGAFIIKQILVDMKFNLIFENCAVINADFNANSGGFIGFFNTTNSSTKDTGIIVFKNCYAHILSFFNNTYKYNGGFVARYCPYKIYIYNCYVYIKESDKYYSGFVASPLNSVYIYNSISIYSKIGNNSKPYTNDNNKQTLENCYTNLNVTLTGSTVETELLDDSGNLNVTKFNEVANNSIGHLITNN